MASSTPNERRRRWYAHRLTTSPTSMPTKPGIYVIGHDETDEGLEKERVYVYIGQTRNLQKRFREHSPRNEPKPGLRDYLRSHLKNAKFWYTTDVQVTELNSLERKLISNFGPEFNDAF